MVGAAGEKMNHEAAADAPAVRQATGRAAVIAFTRRGCALARRIVEGLVSRGAFVDGAIAACGPARFAGEFGMGPYESLGAWTADAFACADALVYVGACGIAVRAIAPHVRDKFSDPAVVSVDEAGRFVVPLLSGHVGGANELARAVAEVVGGQAAVSTATDVNGLFAVDEWAARRGLRIVERAVAKEISARLLEGGTVGFALDARLEPAAGAGCSVVGGSGAGRSAPGDDVAAGAAVAAAWGVPVDVVGNNRDLGFAIALSESSRPFARTLHLVPRVVTVGVGCRRDTDPAVLAQAVDAALARAGVSPLSVCLLASIDVKKDEPAIAQLAQAHNWATAFYTAEELAAVPGDFASSEFVRRTVGVDNVCERAALARGGRLLLGKQASDGTTVAIAVDDGVVGR